MEADNKSIDHERVQMVEFSKFEHIVGMRLDLFRTQDTKVERILHMYFITYVNPVDGKNTV